MNKIVEENSEQGTGALWLGDYGAATDKKLLKEKGIKTVLTTAAGLGITYSPNDGIRHKQYQLMDIETQNISNCFESTFNEIEEGLKRGGVLVHCAAGISRSATCTIAYLMRKNQTCFRDTVNFVRSKRKVICPNFGFERQLKIFEQQLGLTPPNAKISSQNAYNINSKDSSKLGIQNNLNLIGNQRVNENQEKVSQISTSIINVNNNQKFNLQTQSQKNAQKRNQRLQPMTNRNMAEILAQKLAQNNENLQILGIHKVISNQNNDSHTNQTNNTQLKDLNTINQNNQMENQYTTGPNIVTYNAKSNLRTSSRGPVPIHRNIQQQQNKTPNIATSNNIRKRNVKNLYH